MHHGHDHDFVEEEKVKLKYFCVVRAVCAKHITFHVRVAQNMLDIGGEAGKVSPPAPGVSSGTSPLLSVPVLDSVRRLRGGGKLGIIIHHHRAVLQSAFICNV